MSESLEARDRRVLEQIRQTMKTDRQRYNADEGMQALYRSLLMREEFRGAVLAAEANGEMLQAVKLPRE